MRVACASPGEPAVSPAAGMRVSADQLGQPAGGGESVAGADGDHDGGDIGALRQIGQIGAVGDLHDRCGLGIGRKFVQYAGQCR